MSGNKEIFYVVKRDMSVIETTLEEVASLQRKGDVLIATNSLDAEFPEYRGIQGLKRAAKEELWRERYKKASIPRKFTMQIGQFARGFARGFTANSTYWHPELLHNDGCPPIATGYEPSLTPGQRHPIICGGKEHQKMMEGLFGDDATRSMESYLRAENSIKNMQIMMHPEKYNNPAKQIAINNDWTETVIQENKKVLGRK